ncbi:PRR26 isoform 1 [Pongo abelii]|uniref:PRR26 isoform 1 n=1 Tax=Pongo abelii TaxID=9601 RepID=A0A2J8RIS2_PONAB|nr:PRR26 isoform 1 [Pongo abelii]
MESSCWDKDPPGERSPQQSQRWRARYHGARGCGPHQPTATASPRPGLWITPAHGSCMPQTNTRRTQTDNIFIYESWLIHHRTQMSSVLPRPPLVRGPWHNTNGPWDCLASWGKPRVCPCRTPRLHSSGCFSSRAWHCPLSISPGARAQAPAPISATAPFHPSPCHPSCSCLSHTSQTHNWPALATLSQCPMGASGAPPPAQVWDHHPPRVSTDPVLTCITNDGVTAWVPVTSRPPPPTCTPYNQGHHRGHDPIRNHLLLHPQHRAQVPGRPQQTVEQPNL